MGKIAKFSSILGLKSTTNDMVTVGITLASSGLSHVDGWLVLVSSIIAMR